MIILARVKVNNLLQPRGVCKRWKSLVVDPQFVKKHLQKSFSDITDLASKAMEDNKASARSSSFNCLNPLLSLFNPCTSTSRTQLGVQSIIKLTKPDRCGYPKPSDDAWRLRMTNQLPKQRHHRELQNKQV
ncbi:hypothetical protein VIGAN_09021900 [Vigna angularis var. angularis]|uniref:F-box domain-containing protein n=1 Tax=Vigna angularis var. angularis TaxID=157739 RepID=A0A0S3SVS4_PHAAN|nr:hypothetical protein VIGAN_09021900 [Vigna angularis var. angularis]